MIFKFLAKYTRISCFSAISWTLACQFEEIRRISFKEINESTSHLKTNLIYTNKFLEFYQETIGQHKNIPSVTNLISSIMKKQIFKFKNGNKEYEIYPLEKVVVITNGIKTTLGHFEKITSAKNTVALFYRNGDESSYGPSYSCKVFMESSLNPSFNVAFKDKPSNIIIDIKTDEFITYKHDVAIGVLIKNSNYNPIIKTVIDNIQSSKDQGDKIPPSVMRDIIYELKYKGGYSNRNNQAMDRKRLRQIAKSFKEDIKKAEMSIRNAADRIIRMTLTRNSNRTIKVLPKRKVDYQTQIYSKNLNLEEKTEKSENIAKVYDLYHQIPGMKSINESALDNNIKKPETEIKDTVKEKDEDENPESIKDDKL